MAYRKAMICVQHGVCRKEAVFVLHRDKSGRENGRYVSEVWWKRKNRELFLTVVYRTIYVSGDPSQRGYMQSMSLRSGDVIHYQVGIYGR